MAFEKESKEMDLILELITKIRSLRSSLKIEPAKKIHAIIYADVHTDAMRQNKEIIKKLARIENLEIEEKGEKIPNSKVEFLDKIEIYLPLKDLIDIEKEKITLEKEIEKKKNFIEGLKSKLENSGFTKNAPPELIEKEKNRLNLEEENLRKLKQQKQDLEID